MVFHHIVVDAQSLQIFLRELALLYDAAGKSEIAALPELPLQYADYAAWEANQDHDEQLRNQLEYWKKQLSGAPAALRLVSDLPRSGEVRFRGASEHFEVEEEAFAKLKELSRRHGATLFMTLLSAFATLLSRYTGDTDILIGTPVANRRRAEVQPLIGFFVNMLVLRIKTSDGMTFSELLCRVRDICIQGYIHQEAPFEKVVEEVNPKRSLGRTPLFQVVCALQELPAVQTLSGGITIRPNHIDIHNSKFDLCLYACPAERKLNGWITFNMDLFERQTIARLIRRFRTLLESVLAHPEERLTQQQVLLEEEKVWLKKSVGVPDLETSFRL
jgi:hypothetical protein